MSQCFYFGSPMKFITLLRIYEATLFSYFTELNIRARHNFYALFLILRKSLKTSTVCEIYLLAVFPKNLFTVRLKLENA
jgi:hypothetical protein